MNPWKVIDFGLPDLWMDVSDDKNSNTFIPYFAYSKDGGKSIINVFMYDKAIENSIEANKISFSETGSTVFDRWSRGGDYYGLDTYKDGAFQLVWEDSRDGVFQIYTAKIKIK